MIIVTGGAGFIGSNTVAALLAGGYEVEVVDDLTDGSKFENLVGSRIHDYHDRWAFLRRVESRGPGLESIEAVIHLGACTDTTDSDGAMMMRTNYEYSRALLDLCIERSIPLIYASSAAVYGASTRFEEDQRDNERPLNVYGYSKLLFDDLVRRRRRSANRMIVGLRYFNVYGPREDHKGAMASCALQFDRQLRQRGHLELFAGTDGHADGEQRRDFVFVEDVVRANLWFLRQNREDLSGIYNVGSGDSRSFNELARAIIGFHGRGRIEYIPFPDKLVGRYQSFTEANLDRLRAAGYDAPWTGLEQGVRAYLEWLARR